MNRIVQFNEWAHGETVRRWWRSQGWEKAGPPMSVLRHNGWVIEDDGQAICAAWLYMDRKAPVASIDWIVADPKAGAKVKMLALDELIQFMKDSSEDMFKERGGEGFIFTISEHPVVIRLMHRNGFKTGVKDAHTLACGLGGFDMDCFEPAEKPT